MFAVVSVFGFSSVAHAADLNGDDWYSTGSYDNSDWYGTGSYDTSDWYGTGSYDNSDWYGTGSYDDSDWYGTGSYGSGYYEDTTTYDRPYTDTYYYDQPYTDTYYYDEPYTDYYTYDSGYGGSYDYGCGSSCGSYSTPSYTTPGCSFCGGYSTPRYSPPVVSQPGYSSSYVSNTNTNTNTNINNITNTNIDNSIRDSFNNYNSNNTSLVVAQPQTPVIYTPPVYHQAPYCTINHAQSSGGYYNNNSAYLSWSSQNASSAYLSNVGSVNVSGSQTVYPGYTTTYTLTVYGHNGQSATCSTTVQAHNYVPPTYYPPVVQQPYVALTQIPYTGFDFGTIGNSIYWASLLSFAIAGAYLALYFRGGIFALAGNMVANGSSRRASRPAFSPVAPKAPLLIEKEAAAALAEHKVQPVVAALRKNGTIDAMAIVASKDGSMPKIVIERN